MKHIEYLIRYRASRSFLVSYGYVNYFIVRGFYVPNNNNNNLITTSTTANTQLQQQEYSSSQNNAANNLNQQLWMLGLQLAQLEKKNTPEYTNLLSQITITIISLQEEVAKYQYNTSLAADNTTTDNNVLESNTTQSVSANNMHGMYQHSNDDDKSSSDEENPNVYKQYDDAEDEFEKNRVKWH